MANTKTLFLVSQEERTIKRNVNPSLAGLSSPLRMVHIEHTIVTADATADAIELCYPEIRGRFVPHLSRITDAGSGGDVDVDVVLNKVSGSTTTALSGSTSVDNDSVAFARPTGLIPTIEEGDLLTLGLTVTALVAAGVLVLDLVFDTSDTP